MDKICQLLSVSLVSKRLLVRMMLSVAGTIRSTSVSWNRVRLAVLLYIENFSISWLFSFLKFKNNTKNWRSQELLFTWFWVKRVQKSAKITVIIFFKKLLALNGAKWIFLLYFLRNHLPCPKILFAELCFKILSANLIAGSTYQWYALD